MGGILCSVKMLKVCLFLSNFSIAFYGGNAFCNQCAISVLPPSAVHSSSSTYSWWRQLAWDLQGLLGGNPRWKTEKLSQYSGESTLHLDADMCSLSLWKQLAMPSPKQGWKVQRLSKTQPLWAHSSGHDYKSRFFSQMLLLFLLVQIGTLALQNKPALATVLRLSVKSGKH